MLIPHALLRIDRAPPSSVSLLFCAFHSVSYENISRQMLGSHNDFQISLKHGLLKILRIIWVNIGRIFVDKLGENRQSSLVFCGYDDWRIDKVENYTRRGTVPQRVTRSVCIFYQSEKFFPFYAMALYLTGNQLTFLNYMLVIRRI